MVTNTDWKEIVGEGTLKDGGFIGDLMELTRTHINDAVKKTELTKDEAGQAYVAMIQTAIQAGLSYATEGELAEAKVRDIDAAIALKEAQLVVEKHKAEAELEKQWGYDVTRDRAGKLVLGDSTGLGLVDKQTTKTGEEADLVTTTNAEKILDGTSDRALKETQRLLYVRQTLGFDDNKKQKLFEAQINSWGLMYSSGTLDTLPSIISNDNVSELYNSMI